MKKEYKMKLGEFDFIIETGEMAKQANGSVISHYGSSSLLTAVTMGKDEPNQKFFPLSVHYGERFYAVGKIPGGFYKREGKPRDKEILISRVIDRSIRPLFPEGFHNEVQVIPMVIASDQENPTDVLALNATSIALLISDIPFSQPVSAVRVGINDDGEFILNPTFDQSSDGKLDLTVAGTKDNLVMIEGGADQLPEDILVKALEFAHEYIKKICDFQEEIRKDCGKEKVEVTLKTIDPEFRKKVEVFAKDKMKEAMAIQDKLEKYEAIDKLIEKTEEHFEKELESIEDEEERKKYQSMIKPILEDIEFESVRESVLNQNKRIDGRGTNELRELDCKVGLFERTHGSSLFTRGETQALGIVTLGTYLDEQRFDDLEGEGRTTFMLHYNFPNYSVGEVGRVAGPGRREIGHGKLAERALSYLIPKDEDFPYTIRIVSEILESNGSSSMATVCAGSLALFDAGIPMKASCAGISCGLISDDEMKNYKIITDIQGLEDHMGDMDFKVAGTKNGVTSIQLDIKLKGISIPILAEAFIQSKEARLKILDKMDSVMDAPRSELSKYAPKIIIFTIEKEKIKDLIGPGGKVIKNITEVTGAQIMVDDFGEVCISSKDEKSAKEAFKMVEEVTADVEVGKIYEGIVTRVVNFGAFVEILPGKEGLCHVKEFANRRIENPADFVKEGDKFLVKVKEIDRQGRINLSHKDAINKRHGKR